MGLFKTIDGLLVGTRSLAWGLSLAVIAGSIVLLFANVGLGLGAAAVFIATLFLAIGLTLLLLPRQLAKGPLEGNKKYAAGAISAVIALAVIGLVYWTNGGFPAVNLIFA